jgi:DNA-binding transcriptional MerR regulator
MFTVGEFSRLAQVSKRLLRYYDEIGLLKPSRIDPDTGYRFYSAEQLAPLNRILVLKDLGLSLDQIQRILRDFISTEELQGMLLKKAEIERQMQAELQRIQQIESRLHAIRNAEANHPLNVIVKSIPAQPIMSIRTIVPMFEAGLVLFQQIRLALPEKSGYGLCFCMCHNTEIVDREMDLELGRVIESNTHALVPLTGNLQLTRRELPAVPLIATHVVQGALVNIHLGYAEIGRWVEANHYRLAGVPRELTLQFPKSANGNDLITEIQFPIEPIAAPSVKRLED